MLKIELRKVKLMHNSNPVTIKNCGTGTVVQILIKTKVVLSLLDMHFTSNTAKIKCMITLFYRDFKPKRFFISSGSTFPDLNQTQTSQGIINPISAYLII